jgi:hypothetical protein
MRRAPNALPRWWARGMWVVMVSAVVFVAACTAPGRSSSTPSPLPPERERAGPLVPGNGGGSYEDVTSTAAGRNRVHALVRL